MIHRYEGNTGRMRPMPEPEDLAPPPPPPLPAPPPPRPPRRSGFFPGFADLSRILPGAAGLSAVAADPLAAVPGER